MAFDDIPSVSSTKGLIKFDNKAKAAKVSLSDCLACSGCVTSAETVLLKQQSAQEFISTCRAIRSGQHKSFKMIAVTISPQVRASFAVKFSCSPQMAFAKICGFLRRECGIEFVLDGGSLPSDVGQLEVAREFVSRFRQGQGRKKNVPMLTSSCPGWVCYAEKTHGHVLPYMSEAKSPQQIAGSVIKRHLLATKGLQPNEVYHATVMQCPDKKLEGARKEFWMGADETFAEVNCVLTATELCDVMLEVGQSNDLEQYFMNLPCEESMVCTNDLERMFGALQTSEEPKAGGSGGLCAYVFRYAAHELFGVSIPPDSSLPFKPGRNPDTWTLELEMDGATVLRFAASYGFRNIQDVVRRVKNGTASAHFVEVMACPGGCTNGGGLLLPSDKEASVANKRALSEAVSRAMEQIPRRLVGDNPLVREVIENNPESLKTTFNAVSDSLSANDGLMQSW